MYFAHWINVYLEKPDSKVNLITEAHARWMFALLTRVDDYISGDEMSTLRSLARGCMELIKLRLQSETAPSVGADKRADNAISATSCWFIIAAVVGLWGQRDLWQDAELMLSSVGSAV
jgi:hypothetical protein